MEIQFNVTGSERKALVIVISEITGVKPKYKGMPSMAYEIDYFTVDKNGTLSFDDKADSNVSQSEPSEIKKMLEMLAHKGFTAEQSINPTPSKQTPHSEDLGLCVAMPREYFIADSLENLKKLVQSKASLIKKALGVDNLPIEIDEEKVSFPWFSPQGDAALVRAYTHFVYALCEMARNQKRVNSSEKEVENEKYAFRCFLLRLGFIGAEYKGERKILLRNFTGSSAYKSKEVSDENTK